MKRSMIKGGRSLKEEEEVTKTKKAKYGISLEKL